MRCKRTYQMAFMASWAYAALAFSAHAQVFTNQAPTFGITAYDWNGHYGAAVSTADRGR